MLTRNFKSLAKNTNPNPSHLGGTDHSALETLAKPQPRRLKSSSLAILSLVRNGDSAYIRLNSSDFIDKKLEALGLSIPPLVRSTNDTNYFSSNIPQTTSAFNIVKSESNTSPTFFRSGRLPSPLPSAVLDAIKDFRANLGL